MRIKAHWPYAATKLEQALCKHEFKNTHSITGADNVSHVIHTCQDCGEVWEDEINKNDSSKLVKETKSS